MMQTPKATPRFLPTLTEVVKPAIPPREDVVPQVESASGQNDDMQEALFDAAMQRLMPSLEQKVEIALRQSLQTQMELLLPAVLADVRTAVQSALRNVVKPMPDSDGR